MTIVVIVFVIALYILNEVAKKTSLKNLFYKREFSQQVVEIGEEFKVTTILENRNIFPLSFLHVVEQVPEQVNYKFAKIEFDSIKERTHEMTMFLLPKQRVKRKYIISFEKRGRYFFRDVTLCGGDFLGFATIEKEVETFQDIVVYPKALDMEMDLVPYGSYYGDTSVQRWIISDPILSIGIRDYTGCEPQKNIHWASSLRVGRLMVKNFDYTTDNRAMIVLNIESNRPFSTFIMGEEIEKCLSATRTVMEQFESMGIPYGFASNIHFQENQSGKGYIPSGQGPAHFYGILELLARTDYHVWKMFEDILGNFFHSMDNFETFVLITPIVLEEYIDNINLLSKNVSKTLLISMMDDNVSKLNENIRVLLGKEE